MLYMFDYIFFLLCQLNPFIKLQTFGRSDPIVWKQSKKTLWAQTNSICNKERKSNVNKNWFTGLRNATSKNDQIQREVINETDNRREQKKRTVRHNYARLHY